jgi:pre-mRNA-splicing factor ATP-dependent RNA helicase DHX38/PRP16
MMEDDDLQDGNDDARDPGASTARGGTFGNPSKRQFRGHRVETPSHPGGVNEETRREIDDRRKERHRGVRGETARGGGDRSKDRDHQVQGRGSSIQGQGQGPGRIVRARGTTRRLPRRRQERAGGWILRERGLGPGLRRLRPGRRRLRCEGRRRFRSDTVAGQSRHGGHPGSR